MTTASVMMFASTALMDNVYILEMGNHAVTAKNAGAVRACTLAPAAKVVLGGHAKMTTANARVIARSACLLLATIPARIKSVVHRINVVTRIMSIVWAINVDAIIVMMRSIFLQITFLVVLIVVMRKVDAIRVLFGYNMGLTILRALLQKKASLDGVTIPQRKG